MKIKLSVFERNIIVPMLPKEAHAIDLRLILNARKALAPTDAELKKWGMDKAEPGTPIPQSVLEKEAEIELGDFVLKTLYKHLDDLEKDGKLPMEKLSLWEKVVEADILELKKEAKPDKKKKKK